MFCLLQAYVRHPELAAARANRDYVMKEVCDAVNTISGVAQATGQSQAHPFEGAGELAAALDEFDVSEQSFVLVTCMYVCMYQAAQRSYFSSRS